MVATDHYNQLGSYAAKTNFTRVPLLSGFLSAGAAEPLPQPRRPFSILSPTKTALPKAFLLCQWGRGGPGGGGSEEPVPEASDPSLRHLIGTLEGERVRATLHPHLRQGQGNAHGAAHGEVDLSRPPACI